MDLNSFLQKLRHGTKFLTHSTSSSSVAATVVGVTGVIFAFRTCKVVNYLSLQWPFKGQRVDLEEIWVLPGLQNLGNNCFLNVVLQALASCSSFLIFLEKDVEEFECTSGGENTEDLPLTVSLASLVKELSTLRHGRTVLNPQKMMLSMTQYLPKFNLTSQQDAEEALSHLLSSLREELSDSYLPDQSTLADVSKLQDCRILSAESKVRESEHERWKRSVLGPFNGILGSSLTCESCSFQISLDYQRFHSLHLSLTVGGSSFIASGGSLDYCLKRFFAAEKLEGYFCNHCWHLAAIKYLLMSPGNEVDVKKLKICREEETCDCRNISSLVTFPWLKRLSHTFKQLHITRSPKILCFHLQRASMNMFGEMIKLQGHISFPLELDLAPFLKNNVKSKSQKKVLLHDPGKQKGNPTQTSISYVNMPQVHLNSGIGQIDVEIADRNERTQYGSADSSFEQFHNTNGVDEDQTSMHYDAKAGQTSSRDMEYHRYHLVSVVQHHGRVGHGHYTVYRKVSGNPNNEDPVGLHESSFTQWFGISDTEVYGVSEEDVLNAGASLLFYEKIS